MKQKQSTIESQIQNNEQILFEDADLIFQSILDLTTDFLNRREQEIECMKIMLM